jgi:hypothetical protein
MYLQFKNMYVRIRVLDQFFDFEKTKFTIFMHVHMLSMYLNLI